MRTDQPLNAPLIAKQKRRERRHQQFLDEMDEAKMFFVAHEYEHFRALQEADAQQLIVGLSAGGQKKVMAFWSIGQATDATTGYVGDGGPIQKTDAFGVVEDETL